MREAPNIEVGIVKAKELVFRLSGKFLLDGCPYYCKNDCRARIKNNNIEIVNKDQNIVFENEVVFFPCNLSADIFEIENVLIGIDFHWEQRQTQRFQGVLKLILINGEIQVINIIPVENYLYSVISSEMNENSSLSLLKAHAIVSRSWLMAQIFNRKNFKENTHQVSNENELTKWFDHDDHSDFHVCADDHCQRYQGMCKDLNANVISAVSETKGMVLAYEGEICDARYSKSCGGYTEVYESCWGDEQHDYLKAFPDNDSQSIPDYDLRIEGDAEDFILSKPDSFCNTTDKNILSQVLNDYDQSTKDFYRWNIEYTQKEIASLIKRKSGIDFGDIISLDAVKRGKSGRIIKLKITGTKKEMTIGKELIIRRWLSESHLYSSAFIVKLEDIKANIPQKIIIRGAGWGHGVGLCQIGAAVMGAKGYSYEDILGHYYKGAKIERYYL